MSALFSQINTAGITTLEVKMACGFLLMTLRNFGTQPRSGCTNRTVCLLAVGHILGGGNQTPKSGLWAPTTGQLIQSSSGAVWPGDSSLALALAAP